MPAQPQERPPESCALTLLGDIRWHGDPVVGERTRTLLAVLVLHRRDGVSGARLVEELWGDALPANPTKALQVVVSRARAATGTATIASTPRGYRLGLRDDDVDVLLLAGLVDGARARLDGGEAGAASAMAGHAVRLAEPAVLDDTAPDGPLGRLRAAAQQRYREARRLLGMALSTAGEHDAALGPLQAAAEREPGDERVLSCLLRSEAAVRGSGAALERYESYRAGLAERTGADPGPELRAVHAELLAADHPVRDGVRFDGTELLGRDADVRALRALVRESRVTSIVGPGGLGKTRLAHVLGRAADQPVVHVIELVGVAAPEDVVGEVGSTLGVRDSVSGRRTLTPQQRADVRARIAAQLDRVPALLILDNCEHVIDAVIDLVAFLVATTRTLRVLTTSRAPLNIAAERVYALEQLGAADAGELFRQRAAAARPGAALPDGAVSDVVRRLDGLPLAIELAAAKVRVMSVEDVAARLENRFALLRGGDRSAPDRHRTLLAVIDWSWNLLAEAERAGLRTLSVFHDGFSLPAAEAVLGADALDAVGRLADQSLVTVRDTAAGVRYGMLETVREFGRMQLVDAGEDAAARDAQRRWACAYAERAEADLHGPGQIAAMNLLRAEETNLADVLRAALRQPDPDTVVVLLAALGMYWTITGEHERVLVLTEAVERAIAGWAPPPELADAARSALTVVANTRFMLGNQHTGAIWALLRELGAGSGRADVAALCTVTLASDPGHDDTRSRIRELCDHPDRLVALHALLARGHDLENAGDPETAARCMERALALSADGDGPWLGAMLRTQLAHTYAQLGRHGEATTHAERALPVLDRLDATDDAVSARSLMASAALIRGRLDDAERGLDDLTETVRRGALPGHGVTVAVVAADLALARGHQEQGLRQYREAAHEAGMVRFPGLGEPTGVEPWTLYVQSAALVAHAVYGTGDDGADLFDTLAAAAVAVLDAGRGFLDYPVAGLVFYGLAAWGLLRDALPAADAVRLAVLAERFGYNRTFPTMAWDNVAEPAERAEPGLLDKIRAEYEDRRGEQLLGEARGFVRRLLA